MRDFTSKISIRLRAVNLNSLALIIVSLMGYGVFVLWLLHNHSYPKVDSAQMFSIMHEIRNIFVQQGFGAAAKFAYLHHHWRPLIFPVLATPLLYFSGGDSLLVLQWIGLFMFAVNLLILRRFFLLFGSSPINVVTLILFISSAMFFSSLTNIGAEIFFIGAFLAMYLLWFRSQGRFADQHEYFLFMGAWAWSGLCRPIESVIIGIPFFVYTTVVWFRSKKIGAGEAVAAVVLAAMAVTAILLPYFYFHYEWRFDLALWILALFASCAVAVLSFRLTRGDWVIGVLIFLTPLLVWYIEGAFTLFDWVMNAGFGDLAKTTGGSIGRSYFGFWSDIVKVVGWSGVLYVVMAIGLLTLIPVRFSKFSRQFVVMNFALLLINIVLGSFSLNWDKRYYYPNFFALILLSGFVIAHVFSVASVWTRVAIVTVSLALTFGIVLDGIRFSSGGELAVAERTFAGRTYFLTSPGQSTQLRNVFAEMRGYISEKNAVIGVLWAPKGPVDTINGWTIQLIAQDQKHDWTGSNLFELFSEQMDDPRSAIFSHFQYFLLGPIGEPNSGMVLPQPSFDKFLEACNETKCNQPHLRFMANIHVPAAEGFRAYQYYLIKSEVFGADVRRRYF